MKYRFLMNGQAIDRDNEINAKKFACSVPTVSKMLGHRELKTTQIYAKIVDDTKRKAADKIKLDF